MKKIYISPEVEVVEIHATQMLCSSPFSLEGDAEDLNLIIDGDGLEDSDDLR